MNIAGTITYQRALDIFARGRRKDRKKIANHTYLIRDGEQIHIRYHHTNIITLLPNSHQILRSGGWHSMSTKRRLQQWAYVNFYDGWRVLDFPWREEVEIGDNGPGAYIVNEQALLPKSVWAETEETVQAGPWRCYFRANSFQCQTARWKFVMSPQSGKLCQSYYYDRDWYPIRGLSWEKLGWTPESLILPSLALDHRDKLTRLALQGVNWAQNWLKELA